MAGVLLQKDPDILGGPNRYSRGTRVPVHSFFSGCITDCYSHSAAKHMPPMDKELIFEEPQNNWTTLFVPSFSSYSLVGQILRPSLPFFRLNSAWSTFASSFFPHANRALPASHAKPRRHTACTLVLSYLLTLFSSSELPINIPVKNTSTSATTT